MNAISLHEERARYVSDDYLPQAGRFELLRNATTFWLSFVLLLFLSVFVPLLEPKLGLVIAAVVLVLNKKQTLTVSVLPLLAIIGYGTLLAIFFPASKPNIGLVLQRPLFLADSILLASLCLSGQPLRNQYFILLGILGISLVGVAGDMLGRDMIALLPFEMPNEAFFDLVTIDPAGNARIRGFFPESGVLGAVCMGVATCVALGAVALIAARTRLRAALSALLVAALIGGGILAVTITKSGLVVMVIALLGFLFALAFSRSNFGRALAILGAAGVFVAATLFVLFAPRDLTGYFTDEFSKMASIQDQNPALNGGSGFATRAECWRLAGYSLHYFPFGVGPYGLGSVLTKPHDVMITSEMEFFFSRDIFGLKNGLANMIAETGVVGLALLLYYLWRNFAVPAWRNRASGSKAGTLVAGLYCASALAFLAFLASCELYPALALLLVLKCHADAVAESCDTAAEAMEPENANALHSNHSNTESAATS